MSTALRHTANTITDAALDSLYGELDLTRKDLRAAEDELRERRRPPARAVETVELPTPPAAPVQPMTVACPRCQALPLQRCRDANNGITIRKIHTARHIAAQGTSA